MTSAHWSDRAHNEVSLIRYSAQMLVGGEILALILIAAALVTMIVTRDLSAPETRVSNLLFQLELFAPLLEVVIFSGTVAPEVCARRAEFSRASAMGVRSLTLRKLLHATLFTTALYFAVLLVLRVTYAEFEILPALGILLPGALYISMLGLLAATAARISSVAYVVGVSAVLLSVSVSQIKPLILDSYHQRRSLINTRLLGEENWLIAKLFFLVVALVLADFLLRMLQPSANRLRLALLATALVGGGYAGIHWAWQRPEIPWPSLVDAGEIVEIREDQGQLLVRTTVRRIAWRGDRKRKTTDIKEIHDANSAGHWKKTTESPCFLNGEIDCQDLELAGSLQPATGHLQLVARMKVKTFERPLRQLSFRLAWELQISELEVDGRATDFRRHGDLAIVPLNESTEVGQVLNLKLTYSGQLRPPDRMMFERIDKDLLFAMTRWFLSVNDLFQEDLDLFTCRVVLQVPPGYRWPSAALTREEAGMAVFEWESPVPIHVVPLCVGRFREFEEQYNDIPISVCSLSVHPSDARKLLERSAAVLESFEKAFGKYPFPRLSIIEFPFQGASGHAYAGMVTLRPDTLRRDQLRGALDLLLPHEIAHLWWNNAMPRWVAEGCAVYSNYHILEQTQGQAAAIDLLDDKLYPHFRPAEDTPVPLSKDNETATGAHIKGGYLLVMLQSRLKTTALLDALKSFYQDHEDASIAVRSQWSQEFSSRLKTVAGESLQTFLDDWVWSVKQFNPAVGTVQQEKSDEGYEIRVALEHRGKIQFPVPVRMTFADGSERIITWDTPAAQEELTLRNRQPLVQVEMDPQHLLLDWNRNNNHGRPGSGVQSKAVQDKPHLANWTTYSTADGLSGRDVRCLLFGNGRLYAAVFSLGQLMKGRWGLDCFDTHWRPFEPTGNSPAILSCLAQGAGANLWAGARNTLWRIDEKGVNDLVLKEVRPRGEFGTGNFSVNTKANSSIPGSHVYCLLVDSNDNLWVGTDHGSSVFNPGQNRWRHFSKADALPGEEILALAEHADGTIWAGTEHGLARFEDETWTVPPGCPDDLVLSIAAGPQGTLWAGTYRFGLLRFRQERIERFSSSNSELPHDMVPALVTDRAGKIWAGTSAGLVSFDGKNWQHFDFDRLNSGLPSDQIQCLALDDSGHLWIGTNVGITRYNQDRKAGER